MFTLLVLGKPLVNQMFYQEKYKFIVHAIFWFIAFSLFYISFANTSGLHNEILRAVLTVALMMGFYYLHTRWLVKGFWENKRYYAYAILTLVVLVVFVAAKVRMEEDFFQDELSTFSFKDRRRFRFSVFFVHVTLWLIGLFTTLLNTRYAIEQQQREIINQQNEAQLKFLRSQINPHFLFNTFNNLYALVHLKSDAAAPMLLKLSEMLRYSLYECDAAKVPMQKEIQYIRDYIDLQVWHEKDKHKVTLEVENHAPDLMIGPMLFINFIENSFKYANPNNRRSWIRIKLQVHANKVDFGIENSISENPQTSGGVGIANTRQRLELLYPNRHELQITAKPDSFRVHLILNLEQS